jgi:hypothetical protein
MEDIVSWHGARNLMLIVAALLAVDWTLGVLVTRQALPLWTFLIPNLPFGLLYVAVESTWNGTRYDLWGHTMSDVTSLALFLFVVLAQAVLYFVLLERWIRRRQSAATA